MPKANSQVLAVLISDVHLSHKPPRCRAAEPDWYEAQARILREVGSVSAEFDAPVVCAGDLFDHYDPPAELVNFAIDVLPERMFCVPGQHDIPNHALSELGRSAYYTMVAAEKIIDLIPRKNGSPSAKFRRHGKTVCLYGAPWGTPIPKPISASTHALKLAVVHAYCWESGRGYLGAPPENHVANYLTGSLGDYSAAVFGDNHIPFLKGFHSRRGTTVVYNHGALIRRTIDEQNQKSEVGLLLKSGHVVRYELESAKQDQFSAPDNSDAPDGRDMIAIRDFVRELESTTDVRFDFRSAVDRYILEKRPSNAVRRILRTVVRRKELGKR